MHDVAHGRFEYAFLNKNKTTMAKDTATGRKVCIKRWERGDLGAVNEIAVLTSVSCKGVPGFICSFEDDESKYMVEEWIDGCTLEEYLSVNDRIDEDTAIDIMIKICSVVDALHKSEGEYLHLDIKPSNIMIDENNDIYLIDFESSKSMREDETTQKEATVRIVSMKYSAPEKFFKKSVLQSDVFSIGKVAETLFSQVETVRDYIIQIIDKCTRFKIEERYGDVSEVRDAFLFKNEEETSISVLVDYNMCFSGELGSILASEYGLVVGIFALSERGENRLIYYSMPGEYFSHMREQNTIQVSESSTIVEYPSPYGTAEKNRLFYKGRSEWIRKKCLHKVSDEKELYISGMNFIEEIMLSDYEEARDFISWGKQHFDVLIIATDRNDDNITTDIVCNLCDYIVTTPQSNIDDIEATYQFFKTHALKNGYSNNKVRYVAWDYDEVNSLPEDSIRIMVGPGQYLGAVNRTDYRQYKKNYMSEGKITTIKDNSFQYEKIIKNLLRGREVRE